MTTIIEFLYHELRPEDFKAMVDDLTDEQKEAIKQQNPTARKLIEEYE